MIGCRQRDDVRVLLYPPWILRAGIAAATPGPSGSGSESLVCARGNVVVAVSTPPAAVATNMLLREIARFLVRVTHSPFTLLSELFGKRSAVNEEWRSDTAIMSSKTGVPSSRAHQRHHHLCTA